MGGKENRRFKKRPTNGIDCTASENAASPIVLANVGVSSSSRSQSRNSSTFAFELTKIVDATSPIPSVKCLMISDLSGANTSRNMVAALIVSARSGTFIPAATPNSGRKPSRSKADPTVSSDNELRSPPRRRESTGSAPRRGAASARMRPTSIAFATTPNPRIAPSASAWARSGQCSKSASSARPHTSGAAAGGVPRHHSWTNCRQDDPNSTGIPVGSDKMIVQIRLAVSSSSFVRSTWYGARSTPFQWVLELTCRLPFSQAAQNAKRVERLRNPPRRYADPW